VGVTSNGFTFAAPHDCRMLGVIGFDTTAPAVIADFVREWRTVQGRQEQRGAEARISARILSAKPTQRGCVKADCGVVTPRVANRKTT